MSDFVLKYADTRGEVHSQVAQGASAQELRERYTQQGFLVYSVKPKTAGLSLTGEITIPGRRKTLNMLRNPRVSLLVHSLPGDGAEFTYASISGAVELTDDPDGRFHQVMYDLHMGGAAAPSEPGAHRLIVRLRPERIYAPPSYAAPVEQHV